MNSRYILNFNSWKTRALNEQIEDEPMQGPESLEDPDRGPNVGCDNWSATVTTDQSPYQTGVVSSVWNGSGKPKITIDKADKDGFILTYLGPSVGFVLIHGKCGSGDTIHQACIVLERELNKHFKWLAKDGILVKSDYDGIKLDGPVSAENKKKRLTLTIPLLPATEADAITNFKRRGGWGHPQTIGLAELKNEASAKSSKGCDGVHTYFYPNPPIPKADLTEHFIFWRDLKGAGYVKKENPMIQDPDPQLSIDPMIQDPDPQPGIVNPEPLPIVPMPNQESDPIFIKDPIQPNIVPLDSSGTPVTFK